MISSEYSGGMISTQKSCGTEVTKPEELLKYKPNMGGAGSVDQVLSYYSTTHRSLKWYKNLRFLSLK